MGGGDIEATDRAGLTDRTLEDTAQRRCLAPWCGGTDPRIPSPRRARFHAYLAEARGETAVRVIAPDLEWRLPPMTNEEA